MSRKHYQAAAESLRFARPFAFDTYQHGTDEANGVVVAACDQWTADVRAIADVFAADNGRFDRSRFYAACGLEAVR
jgi:hypothetical protein